MTRNGRGWTLVMQSRRSKADGPKLNWLRAIHEVAIRSGTYGDDLTAFEVHVGLDRWHDIGTEARHEVGHVVGVPLRQAMYGLALVEEDEYLLQTSGYWHAACWSGSLWGGTTASGHVPAPHWASAGPGDDWEWGALWLR